MRLQFDELYREWDCRTCTAELRAFRGHDGPGAQPWQVQLRRGEPPETFERCPIAMLRTDTFRWLVFWMDYERGLVPWPGALLDQPVRWYHAMRVIAEMVAEGEREAIEAAGGARGGLAERGRSRTWDEWAAGG